MAAPLPLLDPVLAHAAAATLGAVLLLGAVEKLREPLLFQDAVDNYRLLPAPLVAPVARALPWAEGLAGLLLLPLATRTWGALAALALLLLLSGAMALNLLRGRSRIDCGCGGLRHTPLGPGLLLRNAALAGLGLLALAPVAARDGGWLGFAAAAGATLFGLGLYHLAHVLLSHHAHLTDLRNTP
ncbi:MauE/DoxX family redox-associated membrane protein [Pseudorhodoferax sp.]|uniref:MauE/DoxX family redox-associated membrane protein n=1 Tax=Pseudorhodoferax sp. TaxID=1993553 RepID=UPI002DD62C63|nr:MauE/DoxX family redox-associated membrane protein [Pseudorhodoferax sp.]